MARIKPYTLEQRQALVEAANADVRTLHQEWDKLEHLYAMGSVEGYAAATSTSVSAAGKLFEGIVGLAPEVLNLALPHMNILVESVTSRDPDIIVEPLSGGTDADDAALIAQNLAKYFWKRTNATSDLADATKDCVVIGNGFMKVGWNLTETEVEKDEEKILDELDRLIETDRALALERGHASTSTIEELREMISLTETIVEEDEPFVEYVNPRNIRVPSDARRLWESRWVAQIVRKPIDELCATLNITDPSRIKRNVESSASSASAWQGYDNRLAPFEYAEVIEFYDMRSRRMSVFQLGSDEDLYEDELPFSHRFPPFVHIANYRRRPSDFWAFGDLKNVAGLLAMVNETLTYQMENMRLGAGDKTFIDEKILTPEVIKKLSIPGPSAIPVKRGDTPMGELTHTIQRQAVSNDVYTAKDQVQASVAEVLGISELQRGMVSAANRVSGTGAAAVEGHTALRNGTKQAAVEKAVSDAVQLLISLCQEFLAEDTALRVTGSRGNGVVSVSPEDIQGEFSYSVEGGSTRAVNSATREKRAFDRLNVVIPALVNNGYDPELTLRASMRDLGLDPNVYLKKVAEAPAPEEQPAPDDFGVMSAETGPAMDVGGLAASAAVEGDIVL